MNEYLAQLYGTGQTAGQDSLEKTAAVEVLSALAEANGEDLSDVDWDEVSEEEIKALIDEEVGFEKEAAPGVAAVAGAPVKAVGNLLGRAKDWVLGGKARYGKASQNFMNAVKGVHGKSGDALTAGQRAAHLGEAAMNVAPEIAGTAVAGKMLLGGKQSEASVLDEVVAARALEMLDADGWDLDKLAELQEDMEKEAAYRDWASERDKLTGTKKFTRAERGKRGGIKAIIGGSYSDEGREINDVLSGKLPLTRFGTKRMKKHREWQEERLAEEKENTRKHQGELSKSSSAIDTLAELRAVEFLDNLGLLED